MTQRPKANLWLVPSPAILGSARADDRPSNAPHTLMQLKSMVGQIADGADRLEREVADLLCLLRLLDTHRQVTARGFAAPPGPSGRQASCR